MILTDGVHIVSENLDELHEFAKRAGIKRCWFEGLRKGHPHYDKPKRISVEHLASLGAKLTTSKELIAAFGENND